MLDMVLYHSGCWDGFCAAWITHKVWPEAEYIPVQYGQDPPDVTGKHVLIVDFSYKRDVLIKMRESAMKLEVLDHHKTAQEELAGLDFCVFDMDKSGGRLAWEWLHADIPSHWLVDYTEDRDLWRHALPNSKEVNAALRSYPLDFYVWNTLSMMSATDLMREGESILRYQQTVVDSHVRHAREIELDGHKILAVNATTLFSEIAGELAKDRPFGAAYFIRDDGKKQWSLRSREGGVDVSEIARSHGGGGHRNAAGFEEECHA